MKTLDEKHETIIDFWHKPLVDNARQDEIIPHQKKVSSVYFYRSLFINEQEVFIKIELTREMVLDLSDKIQDIENQIVEMPFDNLPF